MAKASDGEVVIGHDVDMLVDLFLAADRSSAGRLIDDWASAHGYGSLLTELIEPALLKFGELWSSQTNVSLSQGYIAAKIAEDTFLAARTDSLSPERRSASAPAERDRWRSSAPQAALRVLRAAGNFFDPLCMSSRPPASRLVQSGEYLSRRCGAVKGSTQASQRQGYCPLPFRYR